MEGYQSQTAKGHEEPFSVQFSVFLSNRVGQLYEMLNLFSEKELSLLGVSIVDSTDWAVIRMIFAEPGKARRVLQEAELPFTESDVLLICLAGAEDLPRVCGHLLQAEINVHFAYPLSVRYDEKAVMVFHVDDLVTAAQTLTRHGLQLLGHEDMEGGGA